MLPYGFYKVPKIASVGVKGQNSFRWLLILQNASHICILLLLGAVSW